MRTKKKQRMMVAVVLVMLLSLGTLLVGLAQPETGRGVTPVEMSEGPGGNEPPPGDLDGPDGEMEYAFKIDLGDESFNLDEPTTFKIGDDDTSYVNETDDPMIDFSVTITKRADGFFDFEDASQPVYYAYGKGGPSGYMYSYWNPEGTPHFPNGVRDDTGLTSPVDGWSHITFYFTEEQLGQLEIEKVFDTDDVIGDVELPDEIVVQVSGPSFEDEEDGYIEVTLDEDNEWKVLLENLIVGEYTVIEPDPGDEWDVSISPSQPVDVGPFVEDEDLVQVVITNTYIPGELIINKQWIFDELFFDDEIPEFITVLIEGPSFGEDGLEVELDQDNDWTYKNDNLLPGKYMISELDVDTDTWTVIYVVDEVSSSDPVEVEVENGESTEVTIQNIFLFEDETIWAYSAEAYDDGARGETIPGNVYRNNEIEGNNSNAWGWTNFINSEGTHEFYLFAGAGQNDTERGTKVGTLTVEVYDNQAKVEYNVEAPYTISEYHLWVGETPLPMVRRGRNEVPTAAPGQFPYTDGAIVEVDIDTGFFVAAHGVVRIPSVEME